MKRTVLRTFIVCMVMGIGAEVHAQTTFVFTPLHTNRTDTLGSDIVLDATVRNISAAPLTLVFVRRLNNLPAGWESSLCFDVCFPPHIDSVMTTSLYGSSPLAPQETRTISVHVYPAVNHGTGFVRILVKNAANPGDSVGTMLTASTTTTSVRISDDLPLRYSLEQNFPNPFNPTTTIVFSVKDPGFTTLKVFDLTGREVQTLVSDGLTPGTYKAIMDASGLASGTYFYQLQSNRFIGTKKFTVLK